MIDKVIVTVKLDNGAFSIDMELPAQLFVKELAPKMLEALEQIDPRRFMGMDELTLINKGSILSESSTLYSEAVWDGSILIVR